MEMSKKDLELPLILHSQTSLHNLPNSCKSYQMVVSLRLLARAKTWKNFCAYFLPEDYSIFLNNL